MTETDMVRLNEDLRRAVQIDIRGRKRDNGTQWYRQAPRSRGYHTFVWPGPPALLKVGKDNVNEEDWSKSIEEVGEIHIWTNSDGPSIYWEVSGDGPLQRTN